MSFITLLKPPNDQVEARIRGRCFVNMLLIPQMARLFWVVSGSQNVPRPMHDLPSAGKSIIRNVKFASSSSGKALRN
jgi:hypothetical protein